MTATQHPAQDSSKQVSQQDVSRLSYILNSMKRFFPCESEQWAALDKVARELQQCPNCLNDGCHCATCNPYPGELQQAQVVGGKIANGHHCGLPEHLCNHPSHTTPQSSAPVVGDAWRDPSDLPEIGKSVLVAYKAGRHTVVGEGYYWDYKKGVHDEKGAPHWTLQSHDYTVIVVGWREMPTYESALTGRGS